MKQISVLELQQDLGRVVAELRRGESMILTHHGKPIARLRVPPPPDDPFYSITDLA